MTYYHNSHTRLFYIPLDDYPLYIGWIGVFRTMFYGDDARFILKERVNDETWFAIANDFIEGSGFDVMVGKITDPRNHDLGTPLFEFRDCHIRRRWSQHPIAMEIRREDGLTIYHEFESMSYKINMPKEQPND